jgi:mycofactocin precursor
MMNENEKDVRENEPSIDEKKPDGLDEIEEIVIEELAVDGICGIY